MKKILALLLCTAFAIHFMVSLYSCSSPENNSSQQNNTADENENNIKDFYSEEYYSVLMSCVDQIRNKSDFKPDIALVLGSGVGDYAEKLEVVDTIKYTDITGWPNPTVEGHSGNLIFAKMNDLNIAIMQGRIHYYEGYDIQDVVLPLRVLHLLGAETVILTNAVGAINENFSVGDFMVVEDHISSFVPSPLRGENISELGERFTGMTFVYDEELRNSVLKIGKENNITVHSGIFIQTQGPQFETPAEIRAYRMLGADTVGMSSAVEAIAAVHMGMKVCMINCVTNMAAGITGEQLSNEEVNISAEKVSEEFATLITCLLQSIKK